MAFEKGIQLEITITDVGTEGQGIGKVDGVTFFVLPGEVKGDGSRLKPVVGDTVMAEITEMKKKYGLAQMSSLVAPSQWREADFCDYAGLCGGCQLQGMSYEGQLQLKEKQVKDKLIRMAGIAEPKMDPMIGMENPLGYRNKVQIPIGDKAVGFYQSKSHQVVDCRKCHISPEPARVLAEALRKFMKSFNVQAYDPQTGKGLLRHMVIKTAFGTGEVMAILVLNGRELKNSRKLIQMMDEAVEALPAFGQNNSGDNQRYSLESVIFNVNQQRTGVVLGKECITAAGKPTITDEAGGLLFEISPLSFYQVNTAQMERLYEKVLEYAQLSGSETVLDVYCGIGSIGLFCASKAKKVIGIESVKEAVIDANRNAVINGIVNAEYLCGRAEEVLPKLREEGFSADAVIFDPPRAGCTQELLEAAVKVDPERIVYVSCDMATLARDIKRLSELGYEYVKATPVDMFPHSVHVECAVLMTRAE